MNLILLLIIKYIIIKMNPKQIKKNSCRSCRKCRENYPELDYDLYKTYGFKTKDSFKKHNVRNKKCPYKQLIPKKIIKVKNSHYELPKWKPYQNIIDEDKNDYAYDCIEIYNRYKKHIEPKKNGKDLWFDESKLAATEILGGLLDDDVQWISLCAEPGSGKTAVIHYLIYALMTHTTQLTSAKNITLTTGMSDNDWYNQTLETFKLRDGKFLWQELTNRDETYCFVHRSNFHKRITHLLNNTEKLSNHIFIIDESHFADDVRMTFGRELKRLGLTEERMKKYNIKVILVSATPDVNLSIFSREDTHRLARLENGKGYKGFEYYNENNMIKNYNEDISIETLIRSNYDTPRYHFIRARTVTEKGEYRMKLQKICEDNDWDFKKDDSDNNFYISHKNDKYEQTAKNQEKIIIATYEEPPKHTLILIKNKYQASKRLKLTKYVGIISEKPSKKTNTTVTCNGLIPRFFGYEKVPEFIKNQSTLFYCNTLCVEEYIKWSKGENLGYNGIDYTGKFLKSTKTRTYEQKKSVYNTISTTTRLINSKNKNKIELKQFDTFEKARSYGEEHKYFTETTGPRKDTYSKTIDIEGFKLNVYGDVKKKCTYKNIEENQRSRSQMSKTATARIVVYYEDIDDIKSEKWCLIMHNKNSN